MCGSVGVVRERIGCGCVTCGLRAFMHSLAVLRIVISDMIGMIDVVWALVRRFSISSSIDARGTFHKYYRFPVVLAEDRGRFNCV